MIVNREMEIRNFQAKTFYELTAKGREVTFLHKGKDGQSRIFEETKARELFNRLNGKEGNIVSVEEKKRSYSPALYDLTELQRDANKIYGYSAKETLSIMQRLYENYKRF